MMKIAVKFRVTKIGNNLLIWASQDLAFTVRQTLLTGKNASKKSDASTKRERSSSAGAAKKKSKKKDKESK